MKQKVINKEGENERTMNGEQFQRNDETALR